MGNEKILLIDGNMDVLKAYQSLLDAEGYRADMAESGEAGLCMMREQGHDILITEICFPPCQLNGFAIIEEARKIKGDCEVIVVTGYSEVHLAREAMQRDAVDFIPKPCRMDDLISAVKRASEKMRMRRMVREYGENLKTMVDKKEQEIARIEERLIHTDKLSAIGEMAASICHELRQPLCGIRGFTYLAAEYTSKNSKAREYIKKIEEQTIRMEQIIDSIRIFSRKTDARFLPVSINDVVLSALSLFTHQFKARGIRLVQELGDDLPNLIGNHGNLRQVVVNLLANARDAFDDEPGRSERQVVITTVFDPALERVVLSVADNGAGMDDELLERIFHAFFTTKEEERGTGLGLSIVRRLVSIHHGEIAVQSKKGSGSTFIIYLPMGCTDTDGKCLGSSWGDETGHLEVALPE
ncbi:MAG: sensor histidine kinase [bacterium]